ncbi:TldD/PmbA family protein [Asticcacaulis sp. ZE23SCel15]|uniref:TldD/PmbA family protein n=1 Tax=Asticcacaulis sp. ZE23SCel15 TaxID=3059027 RepID=UPI0026603E63|nr:TldD/PmbA family protein [Asticcacaulis sp. ZE23SCel15]WKL56995.1 TldD/PmbA family protein [Asticcacaulis sp. ZE23SCel15]
MLQTRNITSGNNAHHDPVVTDRLEQVLSAARAAGADAAEVAFAQSRSLSIGVRNGEVETVERDETADLGLRVFVGQKQAVVSVSEFSPQTLQRTVERALIMARISPDDAFTGLADPALLYAPDDNAIDLQLFDPAEMPAEVLKDRALTCEAAGLGLSESITTDSASAGYSHSHWQFLTSDGFSGQQSSSLFFQSARMIATDAAGQMERDGEGRSKQFYTDLPEPVDTGALAAERALSALGARRIDSGKYPVIFDTRVSKSIVSLFLGAISGPAIARGSSYLKDRLHTQLFAPGIHIVDDPFRVRGLASSLFDDEGVRVQKRHLIDNGVLTTWLLNTASARQLGLTSTGHASRGLVGPAGASAHNITLMPGSSSQSDLMRDAGQGVLITSMFGPNVNPDTGDWSVGASGFWFDQGETKYPVNELTVAGNLIDIFARLIPGSDLEIKGANDAPSLLIDGLSVGGK